MVINCPALPKWSKMVQNGLKWSEIVPYGPKCPFIFTTALATG